MSVRAADDLLLVQGIGHGSYRSDGEEGCSGSDSGVVRAASKQCAANVHVNIGRVVALSTQSARSVIFSSSVPDRLAVAMISVLACSVLHSFLSFRCTRSFARTFVL